jgi:hypothetical protein
MVRRPNLFTYLPIRLRIFNCWDAFLQISDICLKIRRLRTIAVETFKIIHKQSPSYLHDLISIKDQKYNFRHQDKAVLPRVRTTKKCHVTGQ